ncbi:MAG: CBS domain-containing protein [Deltaproteobacteria bacterium]|jgi:CBS domain-containing protein|nr:CBS domain-containing protein [Deltaproteobacteria bacterium]
MKVTYAVKDIMAKKIVSVESTVNVGDAIKLMAERNIGSVVVTRDGEMVGILTERDVLKKCYAPGQYTAMKAGEVMSEPLITIRGDAAIGDAADLMAEKNARRLLVTENDKIQGIISQRDVMEATKYVFKVLPKVVRPF